MLNRVRLWVRSFVLRGRLEREMREEMGEHLDRAATRLMERGLSAEEARRQAARDFGNIAYLQEEARLARGTATLDALAADVRFAVRHFARRPAMTITMLAVLVGGLAITTLLFSYVHSYAMMPPAGMHREDDLVRIRGSRTAGVHGRGLRTFSEEEFGEYRKLSGHFDAVAGWSDAMVLLDAGGAAERRGLQARATFVTENYFGVLGVRPIVGAGLPTRTGDATLTPVAVIGHTTWEQLFGRDPDVIGSTVEVNGMPITIVGVAPERFVGAAGTSRLQVWLPLEARDMLLSDAPAEFRAAGRLREGVGMGAASAAAELVAARMAADDRDLMEQEPSTEVVPLLSASGDPMFERDVRLLYVWIGLLGVLVLLVTCTNVSGLLMGLAAARRHEIAVRLSLGAPRMRIIRQLLTESVLLASVAAAAALGSVWLVLRTATKLIPGIPFEIGITWPATAFTFGLALAAGVLFGLSPALHATRLGVASAMRDAAGTIAAARARLHRGLVVAQIAFTQPLIVLLAAVLLLVFGEFQPLNRSAFSDRVVTVALGQAAPVTGSAAAAAESWRQVGAAIPRVLDRLRTAPGVEAAVRRWTSVRPLGAWQAHPDDALAGVSTDPVGMAAANADAGHFELLGIPVVRGREFDTRDASAAASANAEVPVIVGDDLARRIWPGTDPVGRRLVAARDTATGPRTLVVIGVVDDPLADARKPGDEFRVYLPPDSARPATALLLRTTGEAGALIHALREIVQGEAPGMVPYLRTLAEVEEEQRRIFRLITAGLSTAGLIALLLSAIGLYAAVAFSVGQRSGEIAVRMAFGARTRQIVRRFVGDGLRLSVFGLVFGLPVSLIGLRIITTIPGVPQVALPPVTAIACLGVLLVATTAAWLPARRAASVDPAVTLRRE